jgi:MYXO-CTERM domain-containing protein
MGKTIWVVAIALLSAASSHASVLITEVHPTGSSASYGADWFELTNTGVSAVDITGWKIDDSSNAIAIAVAIRNVTSIAAGQSVVFFEGNATGTTDATIAANFETAWFGANVPSGFLIGAYGGTGVGLSATSDAVNIFDSAGNPVTGVSFGAGTVGTSFDNSKGLQNAVISTLSVAGVNGAATAPSGEIGSPGTVSSAPEPAGALLLGAGAIFLRQRRR